MVPTLDRRGYAHFSDRRIGLHHLWLSNLTLIARTVVKAPNLFHIMPIFWPLHGLKINEHIRYKLLSLAFKFLTTSQSDYLHILIQNLLILQVELAPRLLSP